LSRIISFVFADRATADKVYDEQVGMLETDGHIDPEAVALMKDSFLEIGMPKEKQSDDRILKTQFLPVGRSYPVITALCSQWQPYL
jgi:hypothetical protein